MAATASVSAPGAVVELDVVPVGSYRLPRGSRDGLLRARDGVLTRLLYPGGGEALVRAWQTAGGVRLRAEAEDRATAAAAIERMRFGLGVDHDMGPFIERFKRDRLLGPLLRRVPWLRPRRQADPFVALTWAVCEQLIDGERAVAIERGLIARHGSRSACATYRAAPSPTQLAALAPAQIEACGLAPKRSITLRRAAREVASGRADLDRHERSWLALRRIPGIGSWTLEFLALYGQGRDEHVPAGDLAYIKLVGRLEGLGRRATEDEVRAFFAPYAPYAGLAATHLVHAAVTGALRLP